MLLTCHLQYGGNFQIQLLADLNLKKTPQLVELVDDSKVRSCRFHLLSLPCFDCMSNVE